MTTTTTAPLRVIYRRDPCGAVASVEIWRGVPDDDASEMLLDTAAGDNPAAALDHLLGVARGYYRADPRADHLPPDLAIIVAYLDHIA
jgi:hypothetical protein